MNIDIANAPDESWIDQPALPALPKLTLLMEIDILWL